ncbi:MAG: cysteine desulfurase [Deltaproteobacteria bacterium]|nr:cysteine desulfurase [Deltaproteobacteria bacterium]
MFELLELQSDFPILNQKINGRPLVYLDNAATTQKPVVVINRVVKFYSEENSNVHRGGHTLSERASHAYEDARKTVGEFINSGSEREIVFTSGTTESVNLVGYSYGEAFIHEGDEVIISEMEHHSNIVPWQILCQRKGAVLKVIPFDEDGMLLLDEYQKLITSRTKLVAVTYVSNALGTVNPVDQIIEIAHDRNIPVLIDGAQAVQHMPVDVTALDCDFFVFSGHKVYAETGVGVLYGKEKWLEQMPPYQCGGGMISSVSFDRTSYTDLPLKFEAGTQNYVGAVSLQSAIEYLGNIGMERIYAHEEQLYLHALARLSAIDGLTIYGNGSNRCGVLSFNLEGIHHYDAGMILDKLGIAIRTGAHCAEPVMQHFCITGTIRASFALYNSFEDIDRLAVGIEKVKSMLG